MVIPLDFLLDRSPLQKLIPSGSKISQSCERMWAQAVFPQENITVTRLVTLSARELDTISKNNLSDFLEMISFSFIPTLSVKL